MGLELRGWCLAQAGVWGVALAPKVARGKIGQI